MPVTPQKRSMSELKVISPLKCTNTRKPVLIQGAVVGDGTIALIKASVEHRSSVEPFTNPARVAILEGMGSGSDSSNLLVNAGFFNTATMIAAEDKDIAVRTTRGYDFKVFLASTDSDLTAEAYEPLRKLCMIFSDVSMIYIYILFLVMYN